LSSQPRGTPDASTPEEKSATTRGCVAQAGDRERRQRETKEILTKDKTDIHSLIYKKRPPAEFTRRGAWILTRMFYRVSSNLKIAVRFATGDYKSKNTPLL
jgi:hypothetical protein